MMSFGILYFAFILLYISRITSSICTHADVLENSKSRENKILSKNQILKIKKDLVLSPVWPYLMCRDLLTSVQKIQSLK